MSGDMIKRSEDALIALRKIQRRTEQASKRLAVFADLTPSQLLVMQILYERGEVSSGDVSRQTQLKQATITSLVDKLVARDLVARRRCEQDRRKVWLRLLEPGEVMLARAPDLLHDVFSGRFERLPDWEQSMLVSALERVAALLDAEGMDAAPILDIGALDEQP